MKTLVLIANLLFFISIATAQNPDQKTENLLKQNFVNVIAELKNFVQAGKITEENSKSGVTNVVNYGGAKPVNFQFQGIIKPAFTGVVKISNIYFDPVRGFSESEKEKITEPNNIEYVISNDSIKSIRFIVPPSNYGWGEQKYFILIKDNKLKIIREEKKQAMAMAKANYRKYSIELHSLNDNGIRLMGLLPKSLQGGEWYDACKSLSPMSYCFTVIGNLISTNIDMGTYGNEGVINAQNENCVLTRQSWTTYKDLKNNVLQYHEVDLKENDSVFIFSTLINVDKKRFKAEFTIDKTAKTDYWFNSRGDTISMIDKQQILTLFDNDGYKSKPVPTRYNPLVISVLKDTTSKFYDIKVMIDKKILAEGRVKFNSYYSSMIGDLKTYSIKANLGDGVDAKIAVTCQQPLQEYIRRTTLKNWASPAIFKPNQFTTNDFAGYIFRSMYIDPAPLAITPLGKFDPKSQKFIDPSADYLYQKIKLADIKDDKGAVILAYQYLPDGKIFDSINRNLNDFGEQIGKSKFKDYPHSKEYITAFNKKMEQTVDDGSFNLLYNEKRSKEIANYCSYCGKTFTKNQPGVLSKMEFPCGNRTVVSDVIYKFCSFKCYDEYRKSVCETDH